MLSKRICMQCWERCGINWINVDELNWEDGFIVCPTEFDSEIEAEMLYQTGIYDEPPEWCKFRLEHIMSP